MTERIDTIAGMLAPVLEPLGLELFDVELTGTGRAAVLKVLVDRDGGVDLDAITAATQALSPVLDAHDVVVGPYALEVSSPGLERPLRRREHFERAIGATVSVKHRIADGSVVRERGTLTAADEAQVTVEIEGAPHAITYDDVVQARTVFDWGPTPKPGKVKHQQKASR
jgi:ribosome maturation factor RimP